ncbi:hypothetical protein ACFOOL_03285 [Devosia honganensis]|uniref:CheA signal transduction histidine kinase n=1 Tax=Devosia honganensis TaxID=1610527 RepID=A0ABV7WWU9_9HYPH
MADYKELLRRAISALPENNGAARRAVYEKARSALVGQLRAIQPPLPARDITQHRLQLEDCIRQVEQEASEAVISLGRDGPLAPRPTAPAVTPRPEPAPAQPAPAPEPEPPPAAPEPAEPAVAEAPEAEDGPAEERAEASTTSIEDIIAEAAATSGVSVSADEGTGRDPSPDPALPEAGQPAPESAPPARPSFFTPRPPTTAANADTARGVSQTAPPPRIEPSLGGAALARRPAAEPEADAAIEPVEAALSSIREVDLEEDDTREAEGAIERAIETLDREARGEPTATLPEREAAPPLDGEEAGDDAGFAPAGAQPRPGAGLTIFLIVFALLLAGVGGAGLWAWREGYVDLDQMFGRTTAVTETATVSEQPTLPTMDSSPTDPALNEEGAARPGNTAATTTTEPTSALEGVEDRLDPTPEPVTPTGNESVLPSIGNGEIKTEERLSGEETSISSANDPAASVDPAVLAGNQSLLLEASSDGQSGAVPFSGTVDWTEGVDEIGMPTLVAEASIPARNLGVSIVIRKNSDPVLPASHLMEISFEVPDTFIGGSIATLAGVLLKDEELVPGTALAGAAARVVGNSFLFALSASPNDAANNSSLLESRRWLDLAVVYGTGRNAILTLEKDDEAQVLFDKVLTAWAD